MASRLCTTCGGTGEYANPYAHPDAINAGTHRSRCYDCGGSGTVADLSGFASSEAGQGLLGIALLFFVLLTIAAL